MRAAANPHEAVNWMILSNRMPLIQVSTTPCALFFHSMAGLSDAMLGDIFEKLVDLRQQQDASIQNIERLRDEHKSWQAGRWFGWRVAQKTELHWKVHWKVIPSTLHGWFHLGWVDEFVCFCCQKSFDELLTSIRTTREPMVQLGKRRQSHSEFQWFYTQDN